MIGDLSVREIAARVNAGTLTAEAVTRFYLDRIAARDGAVGAWTYLDPVRAIAAARRVDDIQGMLPLKGVPIAVKDVIDTFDMPTAYGSAAHEGTRPAADAAGVALAREAGAVILGKTVTTEFATMSPGKTRNPHNPAHTPGGSSSGSAAAVGAGMVPVAFGTQTAGSIIRPASFCGAVGYKPSFGLLNRAGVKTLSDSLDTLGLLAARVDDAAYVASVLSGRPALAAPVLAGAPRIGLYDAPGWGASEFSLRHAASALERAGCQLVHIPRLPTHDALLDAQQALMDWEVPRALAFERTRRFAQLTPVTQAFLHRPQPSPDAYDAALALAAGARAALDFADCDAWLTPASAGAAPAGIAATGDPIFNRLWTVLHVPSLSVPCISQGGLPVGVQIIGPPRDDCRALAAAAFLESALREFADAG
jgi:amidase